MALCVVPLEGLRLLLSWQWALFYRLAGARGLTGWLLSCARPPRLLVQ